MIDRAGGSTRGRRRALALAGGLACALAAIAAPAAAQCGQCDFLITGRDGDSYTATADNTICVDESATFTGSITLKGGVFENCGAAMPSAITFAEPAGGAIVNHGVLRYFGLSMQRAAIENHHAVVIYDDLAIGASAELRNREGGFVAIAGALRVRGTLRNDGVVDVAEAIQNLGTTINAGLVNGHGRLDNAGRLTNRGRINVDHQFRNYAGKTFLSEGGTLAALELVNEGNLVGDPSRGCNSFLVAGGPGAAPGKPSKGRLFGRLDFCDGSNGDLPAPGRRDGAARVTHCSCFNP